MKVRITKKNGFRCAGHDLPFGAVVDLPAGLAVSAIADGAAEPVVEREPEAVPPVEEAAKNTAAPRRWKKK